MHVLIFISIVLSVTANDEAFPNEVFSWKTLEFEWNCPEAKAVAIECGTYVPGYSVMLGMAIWKDKLFITTPRLKKGTPSTLNYVKLSEAAHTKSPTLCPYPSWEANELPKQGETIEDSNCKLISVMGVRIDACDRLWTLDWGYEGLEPWAQRIEYADPALIIFDLHCDQVIRRYTLKKTDIKQASMFNQMVLDDTPCGDTMAYITDPYGFGLIVYSFRKNDTWRIEHNYFYPDPLHGLINFQDILTIAQPFGIYALSLSAIQEDGNRTAFFQAVGSSKTFKVSTSVLMDAKYANSVDAFHEFQLVGDRGPNTITTGSATDHEGEIMYFSLTTQHAVTCWNTGVPLTADNFKTVVKHGDDLYPYDLAIDVKGSLWIVSSNAPQFLANKLDCNVVNHRILKLCSREASKPCEICS